MKNKFTSEELIHSLPDFAAGAEIAEELRKAIEARLTEDESFRKELEMIRSTFSFLDTAEFTQAPEHYFNNLPARINEKLGSEKPLLTWWKSLSGFRKALLPALPVVIAILILLSGQWKRDPVLNVSDTSGISKQKEPPKREAVLSENGKEGNTVSAEDGTGEEDKGAPHAETPKSAVIRDMQSTEYVYSEQPPASEQLVADNIGSETEVTESDVLLGAEEAETLAEDEFLELTPDEQNEILEILKNS